MYKDTSGKTYLTHSAIRKERTDIAFPRFITDQFLALYGIKPVIPEPDYTLDELKAKKVTEIKSAAKELIAGLEWRIERAIEREKLDEPGESLAEVYREREAIRKANNRLEAAITSATDESELDIELQITSEDWPPAKRLITRLAFLTRFTDEEAIAIDLASIGETIQAATARRHLSKINSATYIDLDREDMRTGLLTVEASGLLAEGRALEILDSPIESHEVPQ